MKILREEITLSIIFKFVALLLGVIVVIIGYFILQKSSQNGRYQLSPLTLYAVIDTRDGTVYTLAKQGQIAINPVRGERAISLSKKGDNISQDTVNGWKEKDKKYYEDLADATFKELESSSEFGKEKENILTPENERLYKRWYEKWAKKAKLKGDVDLRKMFLAGDNPVYDESTGQYEFGDYLPKVEKEDKKRVK